jgi:hypothetical protein
MLLVYRNDTGDKESRLEHLSAILAIIKEIIGKREVDK